MAWSKLADMELDDEDRIDAAMPIAMPDTPQFPYGLRICLTHVELEKLGLDIKDCACGDFVDLRAFATVTSVSCNDGDMGQTCRVELQIEKLAVENESTEDEGEEADEGSTAREPEPEPSPRPKRIEAPKIGGNKRVGRLVYNRDYAKDVE